MSEDPPNRSDAKSDADRTLLGVAPPRIESSTEALPRSPVFVRSGTSSADDDLPSPSQALHSRPPSQNRSSADIPVALVTKKIRPVGAADGAVRFLRAHLVLPMVLAPVLLALALVALGHHASSGSSRLAQGATAKAPQQRAAETESPAATSPVKASAAQIAELEGRSTESLTSRELLLLAQLRAQKQSEGAAELRQKVEQNPALGKDAATQTELLRLASDARTARDALGGMAALEPPIGADLLYEVWTGTAERSDSTELARTLLYSADLRRSASPALGVALGLRTAETCEQFKALLPTALKDGDRRSLHLLSKLNGKRGCGPKKTADCYACLRAQSDELTATINAVKSRRAPSYAAQ